MQIEFALDYPINQQFNTKIKMKDILFKNVDLNKNINQKIATILI